MAPTQISSDLFLIVLVNLWPLSLSTDSASKRSLRLVSSDTCAIIDDLQRCVRAQLRATVRGCHLSAFRRIEHLYVYGTLLPQPHQLGRVLQGLSSRLADVTRLDLHHVRCLSGDCVAAVAACMPRLEQLTVLDRLLDALLEKLESTSGRAPPPSLPDTQFYETLSALPHLTRLHGVAPSLQAHVDALSRLTRLTHLQLRNNWKSPDNLQPLGQLLHLRSLQLPLHIGASSLPADLSDVAWASSLVYLEELRCCRLLGVAGVAALQLCPRLTLLAAHRLAPRAWEGPAPLAPGAAPALCLPALQELRCTEATPPGRLLGLLRAVRLPSLQRWGVTMVVESHHQGARVDVQSWAGDVEEVVVRLLPMGIRRFHVLLREHVMFDKLGPVSTGVFAPSTWHSDVRERLAGMQAMFFCEGHSVEWACEHKLIRCSTRI